MKLGCAWPTKQNLRLIISENLSGTLLLLSRSLVLQDREQLMYLKRVSEVFDPKYWHNTTVQSQSLWMIIFYTIFLNINKWDNHSWALSDIYLLIVLRLMFMKSIFPHTMCLCLVEYNLQLFCFVLNCKIKWRTKTTCI